MSSVKNSEYLSKFHNAECNNVLSLQGDRRRQQRSNIRARVSLLVGSDMEAACVYLCVLGAPVRNYSLLCLCGQIGLWVPNTVTFSQSTATSVMLAFQI